MSQSQTIVVQMQSTSGFPYCPFMSILGSVIQKQQTHVIESFRIQKQF